VDIYATMQGKKNRKEIFKKKKVRLEKRSIPYKQPAGHC